MNCLSVGASLGRPVFYCHGAPGAPEECRRWEADARQHGLCLKALDRFSADPRLKGDTYFRHLAEQVRATVGSQRVDLIGFSIGAFAALQLCRHLGPQVHRLHLVSAAAPLDSGNFLRQMSGRHVFRLAQSSSQDLLKTLTQAQALLARRAPGLLMRLLFANASPSDQALAADPAFRRWLLPLLNTCFQQRASGYHRELRAYAAPWSAGLPTLTVQTQLWHGDDDTWTPPGMADALRNILPSCNRIQRLPGRAHFGTLFEAMPRICHSLGAQ